MSQSLPYEPAFLMSLRQLGHVAHNLVRQQSVAPMDEMDTGRP